MKQTLFGIFLLIVMGANSCAEKPHPFETGNLQDLILDTLFLEKDTLTRSLPGEFTYLVQDGRPFLFGISGGKLYQYDYTSGKQVSTLTFEREGPDGIGGFVSGNLITDRGIFFISDQKQILWTDFSGKVLDRFPLPTIPEERLAVNFSTMNGNRMSLGTDGKTLILADVPFVLKAPNMAYVDWVWRYRLDQKPAEPVKFSYPGIYSEHFDDDQLGVFSHTFLPETQQHIISFPVTDSLLVIDDKGQSWVDSKSTEQMVFQKGRTEQRGEYTVFLPSLETSRYKWTLHDPYRKLLMRYVTIETKKNDDESYVNRSSFIIHNARFEKVAELFFDDQKISPAGFATPEGYFFKIANPDSDDREEYVRVMFDY
jgi:hypothetical protein